MSTKASPTKKPSALGSALAASIASESRSIEDRFAKADKLFGDRAPEAEQNIPTPTLSPTKGVAAAKAPAPEVETKAPKEKVIRDSFSFPPQEHQQIDDLLSDVLKQGIRSNKSEIMRAGLVALQKLSQEDRYKIIRSLEKPKQGRPV